VFGATREVGFAYPLTAPEFTAWFNAIRIAQSVVFCVVFCIVLFVLLFFFLRPLYCLSFDLQLLITPLVSSTCFPLYYLSFNYHCGFMSKLFLMASFLFNAANSTITDNCWLQNKPRIHFT
jgi:hypothetical protein